MNAAEGMGFEPTSCVRGHGLANRLGQPYPTTFRNASHSSGPPGTRTPITWVQTKRLPVGPAARRHSEVRPGIEPGPRPYHGRVLPEHLQTILHRSDPGWGRTSTLLHVTQASSPLDHAISSDQGGSRTHRHEALDLAALPICVPGRGGSGGRTRRSRLMRPGRTLVHPRR